MLLGIQTHCCALTEIILFKEATITISLPPKYIPANEALYDSVPLPLYYIPTVDLVPYCHCSILVQ